MANSSSSCPAAGVHGTQGFQVGRGRSAATIFPSASSWKAATTLPSPNHNTRRFCPCSMPSGLAIASQRSSATATLPRRARPIPGHTLIGAGPILAGDKVFHDCRCHKDDLGLNTNYTIRIYVRQRCGNAYPIFAKLDRDDIEDKGITNYIQRREEYLRLRGGP